MGEITLKTSLCLLTLLVTLAVLETPYCHAAAIVAPSPSLSPEVASLMQEYWDWTLSSSPEYSTFFGIHDNDHLLDDMSLAGYQSRYDQFKEFHKQAVALQANYTSPYDSVNLRALVAEFENYLDSFYYERYLTPLSYLGGIHSDFSDGLSYMLTDKLDDYKKILSRIHAFPTQIEQVGELLRIGVSKGIVMHNISMKGVVDEIGGHVVDKAEDSPFWEHFSNITTPDATAEGIEEIQKTARSIILDEIAPAFKALKDYVENVYLPNTRPEIGLTTLPNGEERYQSYLKYHTSTNLTAQEIHDNGLSEVARITKDMKQIITDLGYDLSVFEFSEVLRSDKKNLFETADECMTAYRKLVDEEILPRMPELFLKIPKTALEIVEDPSEFGVGAYYITGTYDGSRPGKYYVNTYYLEAQPKYNVISLSLHEAYPGHHLQLSYAMEEESMPTFRRVCDVSTAYIEGWGLYSETLGFDLNMYNDPLDRYGHLSMEIFRAGRMVVDTGLHAFGWGRQEALDYMIQHTAESKADLENEIDRYITWPGQAVAYKVGQLKIMELRKRAEKALGDKFDIRHFHDIFLQSVGPLDLVEEEINKWIENDGRRDM